MQTLKRAAAIGGGVIGGGWIARLLLSGVDVKVFDPHPEAKRLVDEVLANAERAYRQMTGGTLGARGALSFVKTIAEAVADAQYIQESTPEREGLKHEVLIEIDKHAPADAIVGSSTSGLLPTRLQSVMQHPGRFMVAHPFNPVYLLPLVELVGGEQTDKAAIERAAQLLTGIGMKPLVVRKEIDAHIADRFLEAVWREGLWLIKDGVATTEEIDDAIRFGFGLRWAQMGLFETYRVAGGEAGMRHFISQFGPCLQWPWTKLTDVPELTDELIDTIASQSDAQSGQYTVRELERIRDDNLVAILGALAGKDWGAGTVHKTFTRQLIGRGQAVPQQAEFDVSKPLNLHNTPVREEWTDYNGHMTEFRYAQVFGEATDAFLAAIGMDADYREAGFSVYTVETHLRHLAEVGAGAMLRVETRLLGYDEKRIRILHDMTDSANDTVLATSEHVLLHVDTCASRACPAQPALVERLAHIWSGHARLPIPDYAGRGIRAVG